MVGATANPNTARVVRRCVLEAAAKRRGYRTAVIINPTLTQARNTGVEDEDEVVRTRLPKLHGGCRACRCGGFFFRRRFFGCGGCGGCGWGCGGCGGTCWIWTPTWGWVYSCWGESTPGAEVRAVASEQSAQTVEPVAKADGNIDATRTK